MSYAHLLVLLSAGISLVGATAYIRDTLAGRTRPNLVSWSMWALAPLVGVGAAMHAGAEPWATVRIFLAGFIPLVVVFASLANKQRYWQLSAFDVLCGAFSLLALITWLGVDSPRVAILLAVAWDVFAALPTIIKAWKHPETETGATYTASFASTLIVLPSIPVWNIENSAFQVYLLVVNTLLVVAIYRRRAIEGIRTALGR